MDDGRTPMDGDTTDAFAPSGPVTVKKYANRRLYNTATSSYITLENLAAMVRNGQDFVVQDAKSGADITRTVLTQIIFEEEARGRAPLLPTSFLRQLIRLYGDALQSYVPSYLEMTMKAFERNQEAFRGQMERSFGKAPGFQQFEAMTRANIDMFRNAMELFAPFAKGTGAEGQSGEPEGLDAAVAKAAGGPKPDAAPAADERSDDVAALKRQLAEMQRQVDALAKK